MIGQSKYGAGLYATRAYSRGAYIQRVTFQALTLDAGTIRLQAKGHGDFAMDVVTHTVRQHDGRRQVLHNFDAFMNHSCDPNTIVVDEVEWEGGGGNDVVASKDVAAGEELSCEYELFEWDCRDKNITTCGCGTANCRGSVPGFKFWPLDVQRRRLGETNVQVERSWQDANPRTLYRRLTPPRGVRITAAAAAAGSNGSSGSSSSGGSSGSAPLTLVAARAFAPGETVLSNAEERVDAHALDDVLVAVPCTAAADDAERAWLPYVTYELDVLRDTAELRCGGDGGGGSGSGDGGGGATRVFRGYDFVRTACADGGSGETANVTRKYKGMGGGGGDGNGEYDVVALRAVHAGEMLVCD
ncbi:hypothetical protein JKP88DRAFT_310094 [Tribonema minus]|uniref:Post-SET domain-containing protein n=1 Tax=Tribonema minus TaxID=303371 RepID=A0A835Z3E1_9STRA|nr:hypothetical protein JKP88DRAFT_310094 [Tribonema minus]